VRHGETGLVFEPTVEALTDALGAILADPSILGRIGENLRHWDRDCSMSRHVREMLGLYGELANAS
jgi:hypothetical protein